MSDEWNKRLDEKVDKLGDKLDEMSQVLVRNTETLIIHERRSTTNEEEIKLAKEKFYSELEPIKNHVNFINNVSKFLAAAGAILIFLKQMGINLLSFLHL